MALTRLYFDSSGNALADGTSWTNRARLITSSGTISTLVSSFNFAGSDALECYVGPGTYQCAESFVSSLFANAPSYQNPLYMTACDSSGNEWIPPDSGWVSAEPIWNTGTMPAITWTTNVQPVNLTNSRWRGFCIESSLRAGGTLFAGNTEWCYIHGSANGSALAILANGSTNLVRDTVIKCSSQEYAGLAAGVYFKNCRMEGNPTAPSGSRHGFSTGGNVANTIIGCTIVNNAGNGIVGTSTGSSAKFDISNCVIDNCANGIHISSNATVAISSIQNTMITNCDVAINIAGSGRATISELRLRDNGSGIIGNGNYPYYNINSSSGTDVAEYVDSVDGDYRIKSTSSLWGQNIGAGDESVSPSGGGSTTIICRRL